MAQFVALRALNRSSNVRVLDQSGNEVLLTPTVDTIVDLDLASNRQRLSRHGAVGQYIVSAANARTGANVALPTDT
jgi:hypothetical protein